MLSPEVVEAQQNSAFKYLLAQKRARQLQRPTTDPLSGQESMQQAECKGQVQGADAATTSEQGKGANQPRAAPAPDLDDPTNLKQGLDSRESSPCFDRSRCKHSAQRTTQHVYVSTTVLFWSNISTLWSASSSYSLLPKHGWVLG